jgi:hypothetical protein
MVSEITTHTPLTELHADFISSPVHLHASFDHKRMNGCQILQNYLVVISLMMKQIQVPCIGSDKHNT